jgi:hypothetical protein
MSCNLKDLKELALELTCVGGQVSGRYLEILDEVYSIKMRDLSSYRVYRLLAMFCYRLHGQRLSHPRIAA